MIRSIALTLFGLIALLGASHAAVVITIDDRGETQTEVFENQVYYQLENGNVGLCINLKTNTCSMFLHEQRVQIESKCDEAQKEMEAAMSESLAARGMTREQVIAMQKMMNQNRPQNIEVKPAGSETIANQKSDCYTLGESRNMCISPAVTALIEREFDFKKMGSIMRQFQGGMMGREPSAADKAEQKLRERGYVMKDIDLESGMPNAGMMKMLPEAARKKMMEQFKQSGAEPEGRMVGKVEENVTFTVSLPDYPKKSMGEYAKQMMGQQSGGKGLSRQPARKR